MLSGVTEVGEAAGDHLHGERLERLIQPLGDRTLYHLRRLFIVATL